MFFVVGLTAAAAVICLVLTSGQPAITHPTTGATEKPCVFQSRWKADVKSKADLFGFFPSDTNFKVFVDEDKCKVKLEIPNDPLPEVSNVLFVPGPQKGDSCFIAYEISTRTCLVLNMLMLPPDIAQATNFIYRMPSNATLTETMTIGKVGSPDSVPLEHWMWSTDDGTKWERYVSATDGCVPVDAKATSSLEGLPITTTASVKFFNVYDLHDDSDFEVPSFCDMSSCSFGLEMAEVKEKTGTYSLEGLPNVLPLWFWPKSTTPRSWPTRTSYRPGKTTPRNG